MSRSLMGYLPPETLHHIARYLHDTHRPSLVSFSSVNKACNDAANVWLFRNIQLYVYVDYPAEVRENAIRWTGILQRAHGLGHVRQITIVCRDTEPEPNDESCFWLDHTYRRSDRKDGYPWYEPDEPFDPIVLGDEDDRAWLPVANLISLTSHLSDLVYRPKHMLPPCILKVLHDQLSNCRLHIDWFRLKSLLEPSLDPHELAIVTSPCLYSIAAPYVFRDAGGVEDWNFDAHIRVVAGMAPNLKKVRSLLCRARPKSPKLSSLSLMRRTPRDPWPGFYQYRNAPSRGALESLSLIGASSEHHMGIKPWTEATDFSCLRVLHLQCATGQMLSWAAENVSFRSLKELRLYMPHYDKAISSCVEFLSVIPPLEKLDYSGEHGEVLDCILKIHGPTLLKLSLDDDYQSLDLSTVRKLQVTCPRLQSLDIFIKRHLSDETEVSVYRALGKMRHLTELSIELDCGDFEIPGQLLFTQRQREGLDPEPLGYREFDDPFEDSMWQSCPTFKVGHVRTALLNAAVDAALARSIWDTIQESKEDGVKPLESLKLHPTRTGAFLRLNRALIEIFECLSRTYSLESSTGDDGDGVTVRELGKREREGRCERQQGAEKHEKVLESDSSAAAKVFRHIWPKKEGSASWHDDWSSLPLRK